MELALYKGPATGWKNILGHWAVCVFTLSRYSHVELVIDGVCYSSSFRDGGVRSKVIPDLRTSNHFDLYPARGDEAEALRRFATERGKHYSWVGMLRTSPLLRWLPRHEATQRFCSDLVAYMLGADDSETYTPQDVLDRFQAKAQPQAA